MAITHEYRYAINGVAMKLPGKAIKKLLKTGLIEHVWKNEEVTLDLPEKKSSEIDLHMADSIPQIGVDLLHKEDITGKGIKVGVIDTGIGYSNLDLDNATQH